ncbi:MAG TPA: nucleotide sugar dehydrogenase, partial [Candidatus Limnocylindria bacterium]
DGDSDLSQVVAACETIRLIHGEIPVVFRSTLPLGSTEHLADWLGRDDLSSVATNPEFLRQGSAVSDFLNPTRIVIGTHSGGTTAVSDALERLYEGIEAPRIITDFASAEMIKNAANAFLGTKLSFVNEVADLCEAYDANVDDVMAGIGLDPRIGSTYLRPGIGFGGSCLPKELANMVRLGRRHGLEMALLSGAARTNDERATRVADRLEDIAGPLHGARVAILGLAFKADTDDVRYSPSLALASTLIERGASVRGHDPAVAAGATEHVVPDLARSATPEEAVMAADLVILGTAWPLYRELDWASLGAGVARRVIFDGSAAVDREAAERAGWRVITVGRSEG